ncbi:MAG: TAXI family TRAP transporter solute-binding subunit [Firmicutes bacterium]|nr:TAXI family TRAP transporter solute-binding subunit [Bacillota bacterium]
MKRVRIGMKRLRKVACTLAVFVLAVAVLAGCTTGGSTGGGAAKPPAGGEQPKPAPEAGKKKLSMATGGVTGTYYPIGAAIAKVISTKVPGLEVTAEATGASVANLKMMRSGDVDLILSASNTAFGAFKGEKPFDDGAVKNMRAIMALYPEVFQFVTRKDSGIKSIADLKGKKIVVGAPGSGTERTAQMILAAYGLSYNDIKPEFLSFGEGITAMKDKLADVVVIGAGIPTSAVVDASSSLPINLIELDQAKLADLFKKEVYLTGVTIPAGTYKGIDRDVFSAASPALLLVRENMDEETVYRITKAIFENIQAIAEAHVQGKTITLENAVKGVSIEFHPGARKYLQEKGVLK